MKENTSLKMLPVRNYVKAGASDPIIFYKLPLIGALYRTRVEMCLTQLKEGERVLEIGFGSGVTFLNLVDKYKEIHGIDLDADVGAVSEMFSKLGISTFLKNGNVCQMPYPDNYFDSVLLISILEHLKPNVQESVFKEIRRVTRKGGQVVYGSPVDRKFMNLIFRILGYDITKLHFSTEKDICCAAEKTLKKVKVLKMKLPVVGSIYEVGHFIKP